MPALGHAAECVASQSDLPCNVEMHAFVGGRTVQNQTGLFSSDLSPPGRYVVGASAVHSFRSMTRKPRRVWWISFSSDDQSREPALLN